MAIDTGTQYMYILIPSHLCFLAGSHWFSFVQIEDEIYHSSYFTNHLHFLTHLYYCIWSLKFWRRLPLFLFILSFCPYMYSESHSYNDTVQYCTFSHLHSPRPLSISSLHLCSVGKNLPVVPSRESNSGLPAQQADALPTEPCRTIIWFFTSPWGGHDLTCGIIFPKHHS